ncbi:MAG: ABC transporter substrate-binding protein, partial [Deltaproteobacteria bacterium]|nr:ABC transporter substrate-binding protein [Deltaproteobacteria bacterium]
MRNRFPSSLLILSIAAVFLSGCSPKPPVEDGTLVIALPGAPSGIDPRLSTDAYGAQILQMTHASLIRMDAAGNPMPDLAERWEEKSPTEIVFRIRDGLR